jgi:hypothetical protein
VAIQITPARREEVVRQFGRDEVEQKYSRIEPERVIQRESITRIYREVVNVNGSI